MSADVKADTATERRQRLVLGLDVREDVTEIDSADGELTSLSSIDEPAGNQRPAEMYCFSRA